MPSAARLQWARFRIGAVVFAALLILGVQLVLLTGGTLFQSYTRLNVYMPDSAGLDREASVRLNGIPIGTVEHVDLSRLPDPNRTIAAGLKIDSRYISQIPVDSVASLSAENVIGDKYLDIAQGRSRAHVAPGATIPFVPEPDVLKRLDLTEFEARLRNIDLLLADVQAGKDTVGEFFVGDRLYRQTVNGVADLEKAIDVATSSQRAFGRLLYSEETYAGIRASVRRLDERIAAVQKGRYLRDSAQYDRIQARVAGVRRSLADLNAGKGRWGEWLGADAANARWVRTLDGLIRNIDEFNAGEGSLGGLFVNPQPYDSMTGASRELAATLSEFRKDPGKFVRIEIF